VPILRTGTANDIHIPADIGRLEGSLLVPESACGLVVFAHGSGSGHLSPRNLMVASRLHERAIGTLLFDLLTPVEDGVYRNRFDIALLCRRLLLATAWARGTALAARLPVGYFGASTGAAAALCAAAELGGEIRAVVSRGGRPDLAGGPALAAVTAPTLLLVGGRDASVIALNREAAAHLVCEKQLRVIPGASHLFEEPGTLEQVAREAADWFARCFTSPVPPA
jgi:putative phosphoribosyl transferase